MSMAQKGYKGVIAYGLAPHEGGTTTVYLQLAQGLRARGWKVFSVGVGSKAAKIYEPHFGDEGSVILAPETSDLLSQITSLLTWIEKEQVDVVIPNFEVNIIAAIPHLPVNVRYITLCHNVVRSAYICSTIHLERLNYAVVINERQVDELHRRWGVPEAKLRLIPHGIDVEKFLPLKRSVNQADEIKLIWLGRLDDMAKGVMWLPPILKKMAKRGIPFTCQLVGSGPDLARLQAAVSRLGMGRQILFHGQLAPTEIPHVLSQADLFLMPSRFEGMGMSLLEAMAAGCVPIATHLKGITDMIVEDGVSGFLCPMGRVWAFAEKIALLYQDRPKLMQMSAAARQRVAERFSLERMADDYDTLFTEALAKPSIPFNPWPIEQFQYPKELLPTWRTKIPQPIKNLTRGWINRLSGRIV
jgi:glycosyltransferase involved in cell wall biosynthesis